MYHLLICFFFFSIMLSQDDFEKFKQDEQKAFQDYLSKEDQTFIKFLKARWVDVDLEKPKSAYKKKKPVKLPSLNIAPILEKVDAERVTIPEIETKKEEIVQKEIKIALPKKDADFKKEAIKRKSLSFNYFGLMAQIPLIEALGPKNLTKIDNQSIADFWQVTATQEKGELSTYLKEQADLNRFSDYELYAYILEMSKTLSSDKNLQRLLSWYFLSKLGYKLKVGYNSDQIFLLIPIRQELFSVSYFKFKNESVRYYAFTPGAVSQRMTGSIKTYTHSYSGSDRHFSLYLSRSPKVASDLSTKKLKFTYNGQTYNVDVNYNQNLIHFYKYFPQTNLDVYLKSEAGPLTNKTLLTGLRQIINGKSEAEAANMIIRFVQTAFAYKTDPEQFNREKFLFPDETIHYPASDCEDRSILFAYLIKKLLGLKVVGLGYPGHIATAVRFNSDLPGDKLTLEGQSYLVCDPTYINANIGMTMPQFKQVQPKVMGL